MIVTVVTYNPSWPQAFEREAAQLHAALGDLIQNLHHIGSTSVPGLMAKPIIDMLLEVPDLHSLDAQNAHMQALGYEVMGEMGIPGRRYFRKGGDKRTHHIHAFVTGDPNLERHLAFRDYLIAHEEVAREYGALKYQVAQRCNEGIVSYSDGKNDFIQYHEQKALAWYRNLV